MPPMHPPQPSQEQCGAALFQQLDESHESKPPLLDLNPHLIFTQSHTPHATNIPYLDLQNRFHELPPPPCTLLIIVKRRHLQTAQKLLRSRGYTPIPLTYPPVEPVSGTASRALFKPAPILEQFVRHFETDATALDIGCGSGRDAKFLTMHGISVTAVDRDPRLLSKAKNLHSRDYYNPAWDTTSSASLTTVERTFGASRSGDINFLSTHAADLVIVIRFLRRGVLEHLPHAVKPGGYILYEHFLEGCENFGSPVKKSQMLKSGELRALFTASGFSIIRDDEETLDDGRPVARFVARRR